MNPQAKTAGFDLPAGTMLGKYEIVSKLAMGGMAEIYLARISGTAGFEKVVVLKRILPTVANDPKFVQMFLDEARLAATLRHPNIADVYEVGEHEDAPFFAMEFIHGQDARSLRAAARKRREQVPLAIALAIVHATATALDYAHGRTGPDGKVLGLVHRDVSTSNILLGYEGGIKLIDFGIARATTSTHQTNTGTLKGKIPYMSPEQCRGHLIDHRSDLFSLGVVMYELTVGQRPFRGDTDFAIMEQIVHTGARSPFDLVSGFPPELEAIVMRLLAQNPDDRYQSAEAMLAELDEFISQHRLFVSPKQLSRYMRLLFGDKVTAWDRALDEGATIVQHLTRTGASANSELLTPPSAFAGIAPISEEMPAVRPSSVIPISDGAIPTPPPNELKVPTARPTPTSMRASVLPAAPDYDLRPRRFGIIATTVVFLLVFAGGGYAAWHFLLSDNKAANTATVPPELKPSETKPVVSEKPEPAKPEPAKPEPAKAVDPAPVEDKPPVPEPEPPKPAIAETPKPPPRTAIKKPAPPPPKRVTPPPPPPPKRVAEPTPPKDTPPPPKDTPPPPKKETKWTPSDGSASDSPFLPR